MLLDLYQYTNLIELTLEMENLIFCFNIFGLKFFKRLNWNVSDQSVQFVGRIFVIIAASWEADTNAERWISGRD